MITLTIPARGQKIKSRRRVRVWLKSEAKMFNAIPGIDEAMLEATTDIMTYGSSFTKVTNNEGRIEVINIGIEELMP